MFQKYEPLELELYLDERCRHLAYASVIEDGLLVKVSSDDG